MKLLRKSINVILVLSTVFLSIMTFLPTVYASVQGTITGNEVRFRSAPTTNSTTYDFLYNGNIVTVTSTSKISGAGCSDGWYSVDYGGKSGYICSSYVALSGESYSASYGRPWTSPKKAIMGGAYFLADGYISKGQNTSYLQKFNVNPNAYYSVFNHQYQTDIQAPKSKARISYNSYQSNGLLSLPLHFYIPIYENMPASTAHPRDGILNGGTSTVTDADFEAKLNAEGFDESYKKWLRELHNKYPNWTFSSLKTGIDFNQAVAEEHDVSYIQKSNCSQCIDPSNQLKEGNDWYLASTESVAYFMDPRNFLTEEKILMFEDLAYNEVYTEDIVKSVLANTFMNGTDPIDNLTYSSMFMEAGKTYNVSPVYLASLSRLEVGNSGSAATSGAEFTYDGQKYIGFYNFYNIGATGGVYDGLHYAAAGAGKNNNGMYVGNVSGGSSSSVGGSTETNPGNTGSSTVTPVSTHLSNMGLNRKGNYLTNVSVGITVGNLKAKTNANEVSIKNAAGNNLGNTEKLTTGSTITFSTGESYTVVIYGDLTGDGLINSADLLKMRQYLLGQVNLSDAYLEAARLINVSGSINSADLLRLRQYLLGQKNISQA